jgi:hypothetical protein
LGPRPVKVGDGFEAAEPTASEPPLEAAPRPVLGLEPGDVLEDLVGTPAVLRRERDDVVEHVGAVAQAEVAELILEIAAHFSSFLGFARAS